MELPGDARRRHRRGVADGYWLTTQACRKDTVKREPGLSDLLVGQAKAADVMRKTGTQGLHLLPSGALPPNPAELLGSSRFADLLKALRRAL